ncbi:hypothetical protein CK203_034549 [Vitis vinifera]|uniref:Uncharacterized protein n=1 Tax=Vitis vinifera TaxID=29760 RepID=A0A438IDJ7_VITVI|nr:hypothetical protein CK203_034549 [Vitis vinifera]
MPVAESYKDGWARVRRRVENRTWIGIDLEGFVRTLPWTIRSIVPPIQQAGQTQVISLPLTLLHPPISFQRDQIERQWFMDALNSVQIQPMEGSSPQAASETNPDFLFGLDKGLAPPSPVKLLPKDYSVRSDPGLEIPYKL